MRLSSEVRPSSEALACVQSYGGVTGLLYHFSVPRQRFHAALGSSLIKTSADGGASRTPVAEGGGALWKARRSISPREKKRRETQCGECAATRQRP